MEAQKALSQATWRCGEVWEQTSVRPVLKEAAHHSFYYNINSQEASTVSIENLKLNLETSTLIITLLKWVNYLKNQDRYRLNYRSTKTEFSSVFHANLLSSKDKKVNIIESKLKLQITIKISVKTAQCAAF